MSDRRVHAENAVYEVVRYDKAGQWYVEFKEPHSPARRQVAIRDAVVSAYIGRCAVYLDLPGGRTFDRLYRTFPEWAAEPLASQLTGAMTGVSSHSREES